MALLIRFYCCSFSVRFISFFYHFQTFLMVLNIFLHLTVIYDNSFNFFTYLKMIEDRSKHHFLSVIFTLGEVIGLDCHASR